MKGYRTLIVNGAVCLIPIVDLLTSGGELLLPLLGPKGAAVLSGLGAVNIALRWVTTTPVLRAE